VTTFAGNSQSSSVDGTGTSASFASPEGIALTGGYAYVGDNGTIRKVNLSTGAVTTFLGSSSDQRCADSTNGSQVRFQWDVSSLATDGTYLYSDGYCGIRKTTLATGATSTLTTTDAKRQLTLGPDGMIYADGRFYDVIQVNPNTGATTSFANTGTAVGITSDSTSL
jgi:hypothetical protein